MAGAAFAAPVFFPHQQEFTIIMNLVRSTLLGVFFVSFAIIAAVPAVAEDAAVGLVASATSDESKRLFLRCKACHTANKGGPNRMGPNLWGIIGQKKASVPGFRYSPALKKLTGEWDYESLSKFLENPRGYARGTRMAFPGLKDPRQRAAVIAYLREQADKPAPLPQASAPSAAPAPQAAMVEDFDGLPPGEGREETHAICAACHSLRIVQQQGLSAERWDELLVWMTEKQGMPKLPADERQRIIAYLAKNYGPDRGGRMRTNPMMPSMPPMPMAPMMPAMPPMPPGP